MTRLRLIIAFFAVALLSYGCAGMGVRSASPAPDFSVRLASGGQAALSEFKGRPLILNVGASWCPHCLHELPSMKAAYDKYKDRVDLLMVFVKSPEKDVQALIEKNSLGFKVGIDPEAEVGKAFGVRGIPVTFFINSDGYIVDDYFGGMDEATLSRKIDELLIKK